MENIIQYCKQHGIDPQVLIDNYQYGLDKIRKMTDGIGHGVMAIEEERNRQIEKEGWSTTHDDQEHPDGELLFAAICYAHAGIEGEDVDKIPKHERWPWDRKWWKPSKDDRVKNLTKAGALIAAEIDRLWRLP